MEAAVARKSSARGAESRRRDTDLTERNYTAPQFEPVPLDPVEASDECVEVHVLLTRQHHAEVVPCPRAPTRSVRLHNVPVVVLVVNRPHG